MDIGNVSVDLIVLVVLDGWSHLIYKKDDGNLLAEVQAVNLKIVHGEPRQ